MKLRVVILAENIDLLKDDRLCIFGGDFDSFSVSSTPVTIPFSLLLKFVADETDTLEGHTFSIDLEGPSGERQQIGETRPVVFGQTSEAVQGMTLGANVILRLSVKFVNPGIYRVHIVVDGKEVDSLPIRIESEAKS